MRLCYTQCVPMYVLRMYSHRDVSLLCSGVSNCVRVYVCRASMTMYGCPRVYDVRTHQSYNSKFIQYGRAYYTREILICLSCTGLLLLARER